MKNSLTILALLLLWACGSTTQTPEEDKKVSDNISKNTENAQVMDFYPKLKETISKIEAQLSGIEEARKAQLLDIAGFIAEAQKAEKQVDMICICTHNSRRSHFAQVWAQTAAAHYGLKGLNTYSGGTEATAFNPRAVAALERAGFNIEKTDTTKNPHYKVRFSEEGKEMDCFSKKYSEAPNPKEGFIALMVCSNADEACPIVAGAALRVAQPFEDPKKSDGSPEESATYDARSMDIATEMFFIMQQAAEKMKKS